MTEIAVAVIGAIATIITVLVSARGTARKTENDLKVSQAVTDTKIDELTREVRIHNNFAQRVPVLEEKVKVANHRLDDLENAAHESGH